MTSNNSPSSVDYLERLEQEEWFEPLWFNLLAQYLIQKGWAAKCSASNYNAILSSCGIYISEATANRYLNKLEKAGVIQINRGGAGRESNQIILKYYKYRGPCLAGTVPLDSPLYVRRGADDLCKSHMAAVLPGSSLPFIRIKAARESGKTSLLTRLGKFFKEEQGCSVAHIDIGNFAEDSFLSESAFFNAFTNAVLRGFGISPSQLLSVKSSVASERCTEILGMNFSKLKNPILLIDAVDRVLVNQKLKSPFVLLLRDWFENKMKQVISNNSVSWARIAIAYSTDPYPEAGIKDSPLYNIGYLVSLEEFTADQIQNLSIIYGLNWDANDVTRLMNLVEGHPYLIQLALYKFSIKKDLNLDELERRAISDDSPFITHLRKCFHSIENKPDLVQALLKVLNDQIIDEISKFHLLMLGLIKTKDDGSSEMRCSLYKRYFKSVLQIDAL